MNHYFVQQYAIFSGYIHANYKDREKRLGRIHYPLIKPTTRQRATGRERAVAKAKDIYIYPRLNSGLNLLAFICLSKVRITCRHLSAHTHTHTRWKPATRNDEERKSLVTLRLHVQDLARDEKEREMTFVESVIRSKQLTSSDWELMAMGR